MGRRRFAAVVIAAASVSGFLIVFAMTATSGVGLTPDSVTDISTAESLRHGRGLVDQSSNPVLLWPPGYPLLLAGLNSLGFGFKAAARLVNAGALALLGGVSAFWLLRRLKSRWLPIGGTIAILFSVALLPIVEFAWPETLLAALTVACVVACESFISSGTVRVLVLAAVVAALATFTRYVGIVVVVAGALTLWFATEAPRKRLRNVSVFLGLGGVPIVLWWIRNAFVYSDVTGGRGAANVPAGENLERLFRTVGGWFIPLRPPTILIALVVAFILVWLVINSGYVRRRDSNVAFVPLTFALTYFAFLPAAAFFTQIDALDNRLLSPGFTPLALSLFAATDGLRAAGPVVRRRATVGTLIALLLLGRSALFGARYIPNAAAKLPPFGYHTLAEKPSPIVSWMLDYRPPWKVFTNDPLRLYGVARMRSSLAPLRDDPASMRRLRAAVAKEEVFLVWFKKDFRKTIGLDRLKKEFSIKTLTTQPDGAAYLVSPLKK